MSHRKDKKIYHILSRVYYNMTNLEVDLLLKKILALLDHLRYNIYILILKNI